MLKVNFVCLTLVVEVIQNVFADDQTQLLAEFSGAPPYYEIRDSKFKNEYFVVPSGPCSCSAGLPAYVICSSNLKRDLAAQISQRKLNEKVQCNPRAGCSQGTETIYAKCKSR